ncbi:hypothetical protein M8494_37885 [Serratia ureilytica]
MMRRAPAAAPVVRSGAGGGAGALSAGQQSEYPREYADRRRKTHSATVRCASASSLRTPARTTSSWMTICMGWRMPATSYIQQVTGIRFAIYGTDLTQLEQALRQQIDLLACSIPQSEALHGGDLQPCTQQPARIARSQQRSAGDAQLRQRPRRDRRADRHAVRRALQAVASQIQRYDNNLQAVYSLLNGSSTCFVADLRPAPTSSISCSSASSIRLKATRTWATCPSCSPPTTRG